VLSSFNDSISRLQRFLNLTCRSPGALSQAITFRAVVACSLTFVARSGVCRKIHLCGSEKCFFRQTPPRANNQIGFVIPEAHAPGFATRTVLAPSNAISSLNPKYSQRNNAIGKFPFFHR
jgi:hypothetical protein